MAMGVTVWDPQNGRIMCAGPTGRPARPDRNAQTKSEALNRPNCEGDGLPEPPGTAQNARVENDHQID